MGQGRLAMMISGPWAWSNLIKNGIDFAVAPIPGVDQNVGRPFVGVTVAYLNRSSPNQDLIKDFLERYALTEEGVTAMYYAKPTGVPVVNSFTIILSIFPKPRLIRFKCYHKTDRWGKWHAQPPGADAVERSGVPAEPVPR